MANEFKVKNGLIVIGELTTSGTITINGALAATQSWVTSQAYLTSSSLTSYATQSYVTSAIASLVDSAPGALDTLRELATALGNDASFSTTVTNSIAAKLPLAGGTLTGALLMGNGVAAAGNSQPTALSYGLLQAYGTFTLAADTDGSQSEFAIITAGYGVASATAANGLAIGFNTLTWKNNTVWHSGNLTNLNQLTNGPGYLTSYTEVDTLATVTGRGASTSTNITFNGNITANSSIIQGYGTILTGYNAGFQITVNATYSGGQTNTYTPQYAGGASAGMFVMKQRNGGEGIMDFYGKQSGTDGSTQAYSTFNHLMTMLPTGNVGIGTTNPSFKLHVEGDSYVNGVLRISNANPLYFNDYGGGWYMADSTWVRTYNGKSVWVGGGLLGGDGGLTIGYGGTGSPSSGAIIAGNVGIGTSSPTGKLHITASGGDGSAILRITGTASDAFNWASSTLYSNLTVGETAIHQIGKAESQYNAGHYGYRHTADGSSSNMLTMGMFQADYLVNILGNGNVGIGTTSPSTKLDVNGVITATGGNSTNWNTAYSWGNHATAGYLTSVSDIWVNTAGDTMSGTLSFQQPVGLAFANGQYIKDNSSGGLIISSGAAVNINGTSVTINGNTAWHAGNDGSGSGLDADLLDGIESSRMVYGQSGTRRGTNLITNWNQNDYPDVAFLSAEGGGTNAPSGDYSYGMQYSFHRSGAAYRTQFVTSLYSDLDIWVRNSRDSDVFTSWKRLWHSGDFTSTNVSNWNTAYGWGNHASVGYITSAGSISGNAATATYATSAGALSSMNISQFTNNSGYITGYTETDTLASVTGRGATTSTNISVNNVKIGTDGTYGGYATIGFGGTTNGYNRVFGQVGTSDGLFLASATGRGIYFRVNGGSTDNVTINSSGNLAINTANFTYANGDNASVISGVVPTANKLFIDGSIQLLNNTDAIVIGRGASTFLTDEELGFGWGGGWYMIDGSYLRVRNNISVYSTGSFYGSIFYDVNDTSYYVDPNSTSNLNNLSVVGYQYIGGQTSNGQSNYQWSGATYQTPSDWTARLILRRDNASTGVNGSIPSLVIFNNNGADQTTASMVFATNECVTGSNSVNLAGIVAKKESVGNCGGWSSGSLNFFVKNYATRVDSLALTPDGNATFSGLVYSTGYGNSSQWNTAYGWGNHASADYIVKGTQVLSAASWTTATRFGSVGDISQDAGNHALSVRSESGNDAFMSFHIGGDYAVHFGLDDATNRLHTGGWSDGAVKYQLWDSRDFTSSNVSNWNTAYSWGNHASYSYATTSYVTTQINNLINGAPGALDTLDELAAALGDDSNFATTVTNSIATKLPLAGGTMSGTISFVNNLGTALQGTIGDNDFWRIHANSTSSNAGYLEIATSDDGTEPIYVRQYTGVFSSLTRTATLLDGSGNTSFPGNLTVGGTITESSSIKLKENVETSGGNLEKVVNLRPVTYNKIGSQTKELGLIAEEVAEVYPEFVQYDENGEPIGVNYSRLTAALIGAVKELTQRIEILENNG